MSEENISQELKNVDVSRNYLIKEIHQNDELMDKKHKKVCRALNYSFLLILVSTVSGCVSISAFAFLVGIPIGITSSAVGTKVCAITAGIKKRKSIFKKKKEKHNKISSLAYSRSLSF